MKVTTISIAALACLVSTAFASEFNGQSDHQRDDLGYYYMMTGGLFPTGTTPNGDNASGGTFRFLTDSPDWGSYPMGTWNKDDWFPDNASYAVTLKNSGSIVYDNNGIETGNHGTYYDAQVDPGPATNANPKDQVTSADKPGLYRGYSMSNNFDWIYAGYFKLTEDTTIDTVIGYYDENSGFDSSSPLIQFDMNIWSAVQDNPAGNPNSWMPSVASFTGDVLSAKSTPGTLAWSDTGVDRIFGDDFSNAHDDIFRLTFALDTPMTLPAGTYFFSHDAEIIPEPATCTLLGLAGLALLHRRR